MLCVFIFLGGCISGPGLLPYGADNNEVADFKTVYRTAWTTMSPEWGTTFALQTDYLLKQMGKNEWFNNCLNLGGYPQPKYLADNNKFDLQNEIFWCAPTQALTIYPSTDDQSNCAIVNLNSAKYPYAIPSASQVNPFHVHDYATAYTNAEKAAVEQNQVQRALAFGLGTLSSEFGGGENILPWVTQNGWFVGIIQQLNLQNCVNTEKPSLQRHYNGDAYDCIEGCLPGEYAGMDKVKQNKYRCCSGGSRTGLGEVNSCKHTHYRCGHAGPNVPTCNEEYPRLENTYQCRSPKLSMPDEIVFSGDERSTTCLVWHGGVADGKVQNGFVNTFEIQPLLIPYSKQGTKITLRNCGYSVLAHTSVGLRSSTSGKSNDDCKGALKNVANSDKLYCDNDDCVLVIDTSPWYRTKDVYDITSELIAYPNINNADNYGKRGLNYDSHDNIHEYGLPPTCWKKRNGYIKSVIDLFSELGVVTFPNCHNNCQILVKDIEQTENLTTANTYPIMIVMPTPADVQAGTHASIQTVKWFYSQMDDCVSTKVRNFGFQILIPLTKHEIQSVYDGENSIYVGMDEASRHGSPPSIYKFQVLQTVDNCPTTTATTATLTTTTTTATTATTATLTLTTTHTHTTSNFSSRPMGPTNTTTTITATTSTTTTKRCVAGQHQEGNGCMQCPSGQFNTAETAMSSNCKLWSSCDADEHILLNGTAIEDTTCEKHSTCNVTTQFVQANGTQKTDTNCSEFSKCDSNQYQTQAGTATKDTQCMQITKCDATTEYEDTKPTETTDRKCLSFTKCNPTEFVKIHSTTTSDRTCQTAKNCNATSYVKAIHTPNSDTVCAENVEIILEINFVGFTLTDANREQVKASLLAHVVVGGGFTAKDIKSSTLSQTGNVLQLTMRIRKNVTNKNIQSRLKSRQLKIKDERGVTYTSDPIGTPPSKTKTPKKKVDKNLILGVVLSLVFVAMIVTMFCCIRSGKLFSETTTTDFTTLF
jgi:hypothetical protein